MLGLSNDAPRDLEVVVTRFFRSAHFNCHDGALGPERAERTLNQQRFDTDCGEAREHVGRHRGCEVGRDRKERSGRYRARTCDLRDVKNFRRSLFLPHLRALTS